MSEQIQADCFKQGGMIFHPYPSSMLLKALWADRLDFISSLVLTERQQPECEQTVRERTRPFKRSEHGAAYQFMDRHCGFFFSKYVVFGPALPARASEE